MIPSPPRRRLVFSGEKAACAYYKKKQGTKTMMRRLWTSLGISAIALLVVLPMTASAQFYGGMGGYGMGGYGMGGYGMGAMGGFGEGAAGPGMVTVKYGQKIYDAVFGDLVEYRAFFIPVPADLIGVEYFDDGTHGDEVAFDGLPSRIHINRDTYLGPFSIRYKRWLRQALRSAEEINVVDFYGLRAVSDDPDSRVPQLEDWSQQLESRLDEMRATLAQFEGYDDQTFVKAVDPSLFESMEGFGGGMGAGFGGMGGMLLPGMPPPPGIPDPTQQMRQMRQGLMEGAGQPGFDQGFDPAGPGQTPLEQQTGRFDPIGRAQQLPGAGGQEF